MNVPVAYPSAAAIPLTTDEELLKAVELNVSRMLAGTEDMSYGSITFVHAVFGTKGIDAKAREIIGLRTAKLLNAPYQWQQHSTMAKNAGCTVEDLDAIASESPVTGLGSTYNLLCYATDELTHTAMLTDASLLDLRQNFGDVVSRKLVLTIAFFNMLSRFLNGCRVPLETTDKMGDRTSPF